MQNYEIPTFDFQKQIKVINKIMIIVL